MSLKILPCADWDKLRQILYFQRLTIFMTNTWLMSHLLPVRQVSAKLCFITPLTLINVPVVPFASEAVPLALFQARNVDLITLTRPCASSAGYATRNVSLMLY